MSYTRDGTFHLDSNGQIVTANGFALEPAVVVPADAKTFTVGNDGTVTSKTGAQPVSTLGRLKLATPTQEDPLKRSEDGLFRTASQEPVPSDNTARLETGALEGSNVNAIETMVGMIAAARQFDAQMRLLTTAEASDKSAAQLLAVG